MNLLQFWNEPGLRNTWVTEPGWEGLYVRKGPMYLPLTPGGRWVKVEPLLQLATFTAKRPQTGAFTRLVAMLESHLPLVNLYIENILNPGFALALPKLGFLKLPFEGDQNLAPCFLKLHQGANP